MNNRIILHSLPSTVLEQPLLSLSVLKSFLKDNGYEVEIIYWNFFLKKIMEMFYANTKISERTDKPDKMLPFLYLIADLYQDSVKKNKILMLARNMMPIKIIEDYSYYNECFSFFKTEIDNAISKIINNLNHQNILLHGFTSRYSQWIPSLYFSDFIKRKLQSEAPIIIGGLDTQDEARSMMEICDKFDYAIWGEGEYPLLSLLNLIKNFKCKEESLKDIPRTFFRSNSSIIAGCNNCSDLFDFDKIPDHSDYFKVVKEYDIALDSICIPIENGRGCRWNKCRFCVVNVCYNKVREKSNEEIIKEIIYFIEHGFSVFSFTGTDFLDWNSPKNNTLVNSLLSLQNDVDKKLTFACEIIPYRLSQRMCKVLSAMGCIIQVGYEATGDRLLKKLNKKTRFADLIRFLKLANRYGMLIRGINILTGLPDEEKEDIIEAANNIPFLRFFIGERGIKHFFNRLHIKEGSTYYDILNGKEKNVWTDNYIYDLLPMKLLKKIKNRFHLFSFYNNYLQNEQEWNLYKNINNYYTQNGFYYNFIYIDKILHYQEYCNGELIKSIDFAQQIYIDILNEANEYVISFTVLLKKLKIKHSKLTENLLSSYLLELKNEYLLYYNGNKTQIISIVDVKV